MEAQRIKRKIINDLKKYLPDFAEKSNQFTLNKLPSKKNLVYDLIFKNKPKTLPKELIIKIFRTINAEKEFLTFKKIENQNLFIPKIIYFEKPYLILEKIEGINLCDYINDNLIGKTSLDDLDSYLRDRLIFSIKKLAGWIAQLHKQNIVETRVLSKTIVLNKGDTRLRDFIINLSDDLLYGVDFEGSYEGNHLDDITWICCSLLDTDPGIFEMKEPEHKTELINEFLKEYYRINKEFVFSFDYFAEHLIEDLNIVIERRGSGLGPFRKEEILRRISDSL